MVRAVRLERAGLQGVMVPLLLVTPHPRPDKETVGFP